MGCQCIIATIMKSELTTTSFTQSFPLFSNVNDVTIQSLITLLRKREINTGATIFYQGDPSGLIYFIESGYVKIYYFDVLLSILGPGDLIGIIPVFDDQTHGVMAQVLQNTRIHTIHHSDFTHLLKSDQKFFLELMSMFSSKIRRAREFTRETYTLTTMGKVSKILLSLSEQHGKPCKNGVQIPFFVSQEDIGQMSNSSRANVNVILKKLHKMNLISNTRLFTIHEPKKLRALADKQFAHFLLPRMNGMAG